MSDIDRELEQTRHKIHMAMLGKSKNAKDCGELTVVPLGHAGTIALEILQSHQLALLSRIKEEGPEDMIAHAKNDGQPRLYCRQIGFNSSNQQWRTTIDNIAKEIRGEG